MRKALTRNSLANLAGGLLPAAASLLTIPFIVSSLGDTSYGVLVMVTAIVGYFAILDLNLTSGGIKFIAHYDARAQRAELNEVISFGLLGYGVIGLAGCAVIYTLASPLVRNFFSLPDALTPLAIDAVRLAAFGFLLNQVQVFLNGIPQALQRYDISARFEATFGILTPLLSVALLALGYGLYELVLLRVALAAINVAALVYMTRRLIPAWSLVFPSASIAATVASFSGYSYLSRLSSVFYQYADTLVIGALLGMSALTYFSIPFTLANRLFGMAYRLGSVVFPATSAMHSRNESAALRELYLSANRYLFYVNACLLLLIAIFSREILHYWVGPAYAEAGSLVLVAIAFSLFVDSATNIPSLVNDGMGHPKITGYFSALRAVLRLVVTIVAASYFGIIGVAIGHILTTALYAVLLLRYVHGRTIPFRLREMLRVAYLDIAAFTVVLYAAAVIAKPAGLLTLPSVLGYLLVTLAALSLFGYRRVLLPAHRQALHSHLARRFRRG